MSEIYDENFYQDLRGRARSSAREIVPLVQELLAPKSVVDIGCGVGSWLSVWREFGVSDVFGVDGAYVKKEMLEIPSEQFLPFDLTQALPLERKFDLAMSLEVAEHLPDENAADFVASLTKLSSVILFSAAIPHQGGTHHVNEQWPEYWAKLFAAHDYVALDCLRSRVWQNEKVEWFYAQNLFLFVARDFLNSHENLKQFATQSNLLALVHPQKYLAQIEWSDRLQQTLLELHDISARDEALILVDEDQLRWIVQTVRRTIPFPEMNEHYGGAPIDSTSALLELKRLREINSDARFLVFAWPAFWWLDYYQEFAKFLRVSFLQIVENERLIIFDLQNTKI